MSAIAALKGYRTQFLYSLYYILANREKTYKFQLEGYEDLDLLDENSNLIEVIQVKNLGQPLVQSDLLRSQNTSFIKRVLELVEAHPAIIPKVVSFGQISKELKSWHESTMISERERKTLAKFNVKQEDWALLKQKVQFIEVNEAELSNKVISALKENFPVMDPVVTAECLFYWLSYIAEKQIIISSKDLFIKVESIITYLTERTAIANTYQLVIKPLHNLQANETDIPALKNEFYYGSSARYEHILNDLDVLRKDFIEVIQKAFIETNVVIIQGASGQGKSTLAYRYAHDHSPAALMYELNVQDAPLETATALQALMGITKNLEVPLLFIINVHPNSTEWLKIVREFSFKFRVKFLVTIRHEDWIAAGAKGIDFLHQDIELTLGKPEANLIYNALTLKNAVLNFTSFDEAWIKFGEQGPLLEFVYTITQGESLKNRLNQQISQITANSASSGSIQEVELLKLISLADSFGAKIDVSKTSHFDQIQFVVAKFEKEYLVKLVNKGKFIVGLHPVRSKFIVDILYDEFISNKKEYAYKCLSVINDSDVYAFLLQCFYHGVIDPAEFLSQIGIEFTLKWPTYNAILQSLLWAGIQKYIEANRSTLDELQNQMGDSWYIFANIYHKNTLDVKQNQELLKGALKQLAVEVNGKLHPIGESYLFARHLFSTFPLPSNEPNSSSEWIAFGEVVFWAQGIFDQPVVIPAIKDASIIKAFNTLAEDKVAKLMLGMYFTGGALNEARIKYADYFLDRLRVRYKIPALTNVGDVISVNFITDILKDEKNSPQAFVMELIALLRDAFPDKKMYNTQGHGHRLSLFSLPTDETHKSISIENLPLAEWVNLNVITRELYEYKTRPKNWQEFIVKLQTWESNCTRIIQALNDSIGAFYKNKNNYKELISASNNIAYTSPNQVKHPQSISNPFGLYYGSRRRQDNTTQTQQQNHDKLFSRYESFFKAYGDIKSPITNFINQSGTTIYWKLKEKLGDVIEPYENSQRLSIINLYSAIEEQPTYRSEKIKHFEKYLKSDAGALKKDLLQNTAVLWKQFCSHPDTVQKPESLASIQQLQADFETKIQKECKLASKKSNFHIKYQRNALTGNKPLFIISVSNYTTSIVALKDIFYALKMAINQPEYVSLKQMLLQSQYAAIYCITLFKGKTINNQWLTFPYFIFRDNEFEDLKLHHWAPKPIEQGVLDALKIECWDDTMPELKDATIISQEFMKLRLCAEHINDLEYFNENTFDDIGNSIVTAHFAEVGSFINNSMQIIFDELTLLLKRFPFDEEKYKDNEFEHEYWNAIFEIRNSVLPLDKGEEEYFEAKIDFNTSKDWAKKLESASGSAGLLVFLLYDKYLSSRTENIRH